MSKKRTTTKTPEEREALHQMMREAAERRREANRMTPEELAEFRAWNAELDKQMLPNHRHLLMSEVRAARARAAQGEAP